VEIGVSERWRYLRGNLSLSGTDGPDESRLLRDSVTLDNQDLPRDKGAERDQDDEEEAGDVEESNAELEVYAVGTAGCKLYASQNERGSVGL
jgi:hypothetical protein